MKTFICNLLPRDTRMVEFVSAWATVFAAIFVNQWPVEILQHGNVEAWRLSLLVLGILHIAAVIGFKGSELIRCSLCFGGGLFWLWSSMYSFSYGVTPTDLIGISMGIGCLSAFIINVRFLGMRWTFQKL